jgi:hypothetical protein
MHGANEEKYGTESVHLKLTCYSHLANSAAGWFKAGAGGIVIRAGEEAGFLTYPIFETHSFDSTQEQQLLYLSKDGIFPLAY